jgi:homoserine kinase
MSCRVRVPATTANIGPGFDCLGLALDLWNEVWFSAEGDRIEVTVEGPDPVGLPRDERNSSLGVPALCAEAAARRPACASTATSARPCRRLARVHRHRGRPLGANARWAGPSTATDSSWLPTEGHPDNVAAALLGGSPSSSRRTTACSPRRSRP